MATQTIEFRAAPSQTVTLRLFVVGSDTQVTSATATEATNRKGTYAAVFTSVAAGEYFYVATIGTSPIIPISSGYVTLALATATYQVYDAAKAVIVNDKTGYSLDTAPPTAGEIADAVYDEPYAGHTTPGTYGFLWDRWRKANPAINGEVVAGTLTTTSFSSDITSYSAAAFRGATLLFINGSTHAEFASPIISYNPVNGVFTLEQELPSAPVAGDEFVVQPANFVHSVASITSGVWSALTSGLNVVGSAGEVVKALASMLEFVGGLWRWKASALAEAPTGGGGDATEAKQDQIISLIQGSEVLTVATPNVRGNLVLTQGDTYDGVTGGNAKATWTVSTDYSGWSVVLTIRDKDDAVVYTNTGTVVNATTITVAIVTPTVSPFEGCPGVWQGKYDVQLTKDSSKKTIAIGVVYINEDQTRS